MTDQLAGDCDPAIPADAPAIDAPTKALGPDLDAILRPFLDQSAPVISVVVLGYGECAALSQEAASIDRRDEAVLLRLGADAAVIARMALPPSGHGGSEIHTLDSLARQACRICNDAAGDHLIVLPDSRLEEMLGGLADDLGFRGVVMLSSQDDGNARKLQRILFDRGLLDIGSVEVGSGQARCFLASDAVRSLDRLGAGSRGHIIMPSLGHNGRFANQLFQYAFLKLYALRHGLTAALPPWEGTTLFGLDDPPCASLSFPELHYAGFSDDDRALWDMDEPPIDINVAGYFQELPECWRKHRPFLRRLFQLSREHQQALDAWHQDVTRGGARTLVAIHVRRDDYRDAQDMPWLRLVPEDWYLAWLRDIWPTLRDPCLFVATDEPDAILPVFKEFEVVPAASGAAVRGLPDHVLDFEGLRRADYLAICNSSFSRMAAILAASTQHCLLPSFEAKRFVPYEPWTDPGFWTRFAGHAPDPITDEPPAPEANASLQRTLYFDVSDLLSYLRDHRTPSGIQRVQCEILRNLLDVPRPERVQLIVLKDGRGPGVIDTGAFLDLIEQIRSEALPRAKLDRRLGALWYGVAAPFIRPHDIFLALGAFWGSSGMGRFLQGLKNSGVIIGLYIHDIISVSDPEFFNIRDTKIFRKGLVEALGFADFILTTSEYNKGSLLRHIAGRNLPSLPVEVVPLAHELSPAPTADENSSIVAGIANTEYVLCVGTIEVRKNPIYLFNIWKLMLRAGRKNIPTLVFAGRVGWLVHDFMEQLSASNHLGGKIVVLHDVTDVDLALLYRKSLLTIYPSLAEGWGLPVGESLAYGKITIASRAGGIPEVGGELVDYVDPYNAYDGLERLLRYLDDPELRRSREREIASQFKPRPWRSVADGFLSSVQALAREVRRFEGVAAITLPPNQFLPISNDPGRIVQNGVDGGLSAELICISGWRPPEVWGARADGRETLIRFRTDMPPGTSIHLVMRLTALGNDPCRIRIASGSGSEIEVSPAGRSDRVVVLSCEVEPGNLVSARLSLIGPEPSRNENILGPNWGLKGILYFQPEGLEGQAPAGLLDHGSALQPRPLVMPPREVRNRPGRAIPQIRVPLVPAAPLDDRRHAATFDAFLQSPDCHWRSDVATYRTAPLFADHADKQIFYNAQSHNIGAVTDHFTLIRRSDQYVSMTRLSEGSVFDRSCVSRAWGYLDGSPPVPWLSREADNIWASEEALAAAPYADRSHLVFYNGNLQNYFHWMCEGILSLDILAQAMGPDPKLTIALPKSMEIAEVFDHRESLWAVGLDGYEIVEVGANLMRVREAIWVEPDLVQSMPATCLRDFQRRVAALHVRSRSPKRRRLFVARKGPTRTIHNIAQVQEFLSLHGFETVYLEGMRVVDQILLFQSAEFIVSPHGAGLTNLLFCEPGTKVIEFMPDAEMRPFFWLISEKLDLVHGLQFCAAAEGPGFQSSVIVDIGKLQALFRMVDAHR